MVVFDHSVSRCVYGRAADRIAESGSRARRKPSGAAISCGMVLLFAAAPAAAQDDHGDTPATATPLASDGTRRSGRLEQGGDLDLFRLDARQGAAYTLETGALAAGMDSILDLYDPRGRRLLRDDDGGGGLASKIQFTAQESGAFWVAVTHYQRSSGTGTYQVWAQGPSPTAPSTPGGSTPVAPVPAPTSNVALTLSSPVLDPELEGASLDLSFTLPGTGSYTVDLEVADAQGALVHTLVRGAAAQGGRRFDQAWNGSDAQGQPMAPGAYTARLVARGPGASLQGSARLDVVRLGVVSIEFLGSGRVPLAYHQGAVSGAFPIDAAGPAWSLPTSSLGASNLDRGSDGGPLSGPAPWTSLDAPPRTSNGAVATRGRSLPVAYVAGAQPRVRLTLGDAAGLVAPSGPRAVPCNYPLASGALRVVAGWGGAREDAAGPIAPGGVEELTLGALPATIGRHALELVLRFEVEEQGRWRAIPGVQRTRHVAYTTLGAPPQGALPGNLPWVAALDQVVTWTAGRSGADRALDEVTAAINGSGLRYDIQYGAPAYAGGWALHTPELDLTAFLDARRNGDVVNCLDSAGLVTGFAAQVGVDAQVAVLGWGFQLHWLRGIGWPDFTHSLFGGQHAFSYHAVASLDRGASVHDACLRVDDDARPDRSPFLERLPLGMPFARYRDQLGRDPFSIQDVGRASVR